MSETPPPDPTQPYGSVPPPPPPPPSPGYAGYTQPGLPAGAYGVSSQAPYGLHPVTGIPYSDKSKIVAGLLNILIPYRRSAASTSATPGRACSSWWSPS